VSIARSCVHSVSRAVLVLPVNEAIGAAPPRFGADELAGRRGRRRARAGAAVLERGRAAAQGAGALGRPAAQSAPRGQHEGAAAHAQRGGRGRRRLAPLGPPAAATAANEPAPGPAQVAPRLAPHGGGQARGGRQQDQLALALSHLPLTQLLDKQVSTQFVRGWLWYTTFRF